MWPASMFAADVAIWTIEMESGASWTLPPAASAETTRTLYFFGGDTCTVGGRQFKAHAALTLRSTEGELTSIAVVICSPDYA